MKLSAVTALTHGKQTGDDIDFDQVSTDTRSLSPGDLFVALRGENFDGHAFLQQAAELGAGAAMVDTPTTLFSHYVQVENTRIGLGHLAAGWADQFSLTRIAVTGNAGKTTVKEMIARMLGDGVLATRGNLNNDIGVPLTLLSLRPEHRFGVFELGANAPGEIAWTASLARPSIAMITNVTGAHLEGFGSMQGIADAKAEIFTGMQAGGLAIINQQDSFADFFAAQAAQQGLRICRVGLSSDCDLHVSAIESETGFSRCTLHADGREYQMLIPLSGLHQVINALMAVAAVREAGVDLESALQRLQSMQPVKGRMNLSSCRGGTLVDDTYNANPGSVRAAIDWLQSQPAPRVLVLGAIAELGVDAQPIQVELGRYARAAGLEALITIASPAADGFGEQAVRVDDAQAAAGLAQTYLEQGGTVLVKGSRSARMEAVVEALRANGGIH